MSAETGECNGRIDGSKVEFELKMGADLRDDDDNGEEIGGCFVIINGDSDDHSERDLDLGEKLKNVEIGGKEESFVVGRVKNEIFDGGDGDLVEERSNGGDTEHDNISGLRSDIKVEEGFDGDGVKENNLVDNDLGSLNVVEEKQDGEALVASAEEKEEVEQPEAEVESDSKVELGSEVEKEDIKEPKIVIKGTKHLEKLDFASQVDDDDLGLSNGVEEKQDTEALVVEASTRLDEQESEIVIGESDSNVELGSEVEKEGIKEPEAVISESDHLDKPDSASQVDDNVLGSLNGVAEKQDGEAFVVESATQLDEQESKVVIGESDSNVELGSEEEKEDVTDLEAAVIGGSRLEELAPVSQMEEVKEPVDDKEAEVLVKAEESPEPGDVVEETKIIEDLESAVEVKLEQEPHTVVEETVDVAILELPVEVDMRHEANAELVEAEKLAEVESATEIVLKQESNIGAEEIDNLSEVESAAEVELKRDPAVKVEEMDKAEVREGKEPEIVTEEIGNQGDIRSVVEVEVEQEPETVSEVADKIEVEETKEPDAVVTEQMTSEHLPHENEEAMMSNVDADAPTDEPSAQLEYGNTDCAAEAGEETNAISDVVVTERMTSEHFPLENEEARMSNVDADDSTDEPSARLEKCNADCAAEVSEETNAICDVTDHVDSSAEVSADSLKDKLNDEAMNINLEGSEKPKLCLDLEKELVEEVGLSADGKDGEVEVNNGETSPSVLKTDISSKDIEPSSLSSDNGVDLEPQTRELCPNKDTGREVKVPTGDTESNIDAAVDEMKLDTESGTEGSECVVSSVDGEQSTNKDDDEEPSHEQAQAAEIIQTPQETHVVKRQHVYMIKVPRFIDDELQKKIQHARLIIDEKTRVRDSIGEETRAQLVVVNKFSLDYKAALAKERAARAIFNAKCQEVENVQALINRINNATSIAEIDEKIRSMAHRQQHETISLKQEKQYIHDINQMMRLREQLSSKKLGQEQIDETLSKRDEIEAKFKNLKKEVDSLRTALSSAQSSAKSAWNNYMGEEQRLRSLKEKHNEADAVRQEAYLHWRKLKIQLAEKAKHFKMFKADQSAATNYIFSGDNQGLRSHCSRQVERIMDFWNNNSEFREQYVKSNTYSTLRRLGTSDGRSLGPGEEASIIRSHVDKSPKIDPPLSLNMESSSPILASDVKQEKLTEPSATKQVERTNTAKLKSSTKPIAVDGSIPAVSNGELLRETKKENEFNIEEEEMARKAEELARKVEELARKEEELRKEKTAAELKEQLRLEQKAKAKEAEERKRRKAEKAQARAEYRAQKEAELKEKKKAKKESKKPGLVDTDTTNGGTERGSTPIHDTNPKETSQEPETSSVATIRRRSSRPVSSMKQYNKVQPPIPLPLRKRGKRNMMTWIWAALVTLLVLAFFFAGNYISFSTSGFPYFEF